MKKTKVETILGKKSFKVKRGALHKALGVPDGSTIPQDKLVAAMKSKNPHVREMADSAKGLESMK